MINEVNVDAAGRTCIHRNRQVQVHSEQELSVARNGRRRRVRPENRTFAMAAPGPGTKDIIMRGPDNGK